jgi:hypothetical protein
VILTDDFIALDIAEAEGNASVVADVSRLGYGTIR